MDKANPSNAHVRKEKVKPEIAESRKKAEVLAGDAERLLNDPAFKQGFDGLRNDTIKLIESTPHDGSPEFDAAEREMCRTLRTLDQLRKRITLCTQIQALRLADFKSVEDERPEDKPKEPPPDFSMTKV